MNNYHKTILLNLHWIIYYIVKARIWMRHPEKHTEKECYAVAEEMVMRMNRTSHCTTIARGLENLPKEGGYILYPNHQGKYDVLGIINTHKEPCTFVMDEERSRIILVNEFVGLLRAQRLKLKDLRQTIEVFTQMSKEINQEGRKYILFPEGGYSENNQNVVEHFKPGSFKAAKMARTTIVPVALVDSYKVYNSPHRGPVTTYVYYLEPIPYEEYKDLKTVDLALMVEERIKAKIKEHLQSA